jgi:hypothetical protein
MPVKSLKVSVTDDRKPPRRLFANYIKTAPRRARWKFITRVIKPAPKNRNGKVCPNFDGDFIVSFFFF